MTTVEVTRPARARNVLAAEWIKLRSVRSTSLTLLFAALAAVGVGYLVAHAEANHWSVMTAAEKAAYDPVRNSFSGWGLAELAFGAMGVLAISSPASKVTAPRTAALAASTARRRGTAANVVRIRPVVYSELIASTPIAPNASSASPQPEKLLRTGS